MHPLNKNTNRARPIGWFQCQVWCASIWLFMFGLVTQLAAQPSKLACVATGTAHATGYIDDVAGENLLDLVFHFKSGDAGIACGVERAAFHRERVAVYDVRDFDSRDARFGELSRTWFERLRLGRPLVTALLENPLVVQRAPACRVVTATRGKDEGADLVDLSVRRTGMMLPPRPRE